MRWKYRFSIFTPTYNRADFLLKLYEDLLNQDYDRSQFEWVIVSDGSTDDTSKVVAGFIRQAKLSIKYIEKENGGKHTAWKTALPVFEGRYIITCDDDDPVTSDMISVFDNYWTSLEVDEKYDSIWEVRARVCFEDGTLIGNKLPEPYFDSSYNEVYYKMNEMAEMFSCQKVEVLRKEASIPDVFPFSDKVSNYPEAIRWTRASRVYKTRFVPEITRTFIRGHSSLTSNDKSSRKNYNALLFSLLAFNEAGDLLRHQPFRYLWTVLHLAYSANRVRENVFGEINNPIDRFLTILFYVPGLLLSLVRK